MNSLADQPAFPGIQGSHGYGNDSIQLDPNHGSPIFTAHNQGMTLRQFATIEMAKGILASSHDDKMHAWQNPAKLAQWSREFADALLAELAKPSTL